MKSLIVFFICAFSFLSFSANATFVTVYGKGGVINKPDGTSIICPDSSDKRCANITIPSTGTTDGFVSVDGITYNVQILEMNIIGPDADDFYCNGITVIIK
ncbi:MAG: hypothetical protein K0B15_15450 [Lentimicrobium sp.]|nr:hypothetical protein [Lentimicrobium sp.]